MDRPDHNTYTGDSVPASRLGGETPNRLSGDAVDDSVPVAIPHLIVRHICLMSKIR